MRHVLLGITGSIAAYKTPDLVRLFVKKGYHVTPILSSHATHFVAPLSLSTVAGVRVITDNDFWDNPAEHIECDREGDIFVVAPASANTIAKCAQGIADSALTSAFLTFTGPKLIVPAMHTQMLMNPATQRNLELLKADGCHVLGPLSGDLACGDIGMGRMVANDLILSKVKTMSFPTHNLIGKRLLITAGGTKESIDSVRCLSNHSTGKLGRVLAEVGAFYGASVTLVTTCPSDETLYRTVPVSSVKELSLAVKTHVSDADCLFMAAAVSDFSVKSYKGKLSRQEGVSLSLLPTEDILGGLVSQKKNKVFIGFCLEDDDLETKAKLKLKQKQCDYIVANHSTNIGREKRSLSVYSARKQEPVLKLEDCDLYEVAHHLLGLVF